MFITTSGWLYIAFLDLKHGFVHLQANVGGTVGDCQQQKLSEGKC